MLNRFVKISLLSSCLLFFSCNDLKNISNQMESIKGDLDQIIMKQADLDKKMALLQSSVKNINVASKQSGKDNKKPQKRKTPNPNYAHNIDVGGSVVLGNPNAKVTITKFTDFQ
jgi:protein-disulfide isomerase